MTEVPLPQIRDHNYSLCTVGKFLTVAPEEHRLRYSRDCCLSDPLIIWDPHDNADGFMVTGRTVAELNEAFREYFADWIDFHD